MNSLSLLLIILAPLVEGSHHRQTEKKTSPDKPPSSTAPSSPSQSRDETTTFSLSCGTAGLSQAAERELGCAQAQAETDPLDPQAVLTFVIREQGTANALSKPEQKMVKRYWKMYKSRLTLKIVFKTDNEDYARNVFILASLPSGKIVGFTQLVMNKHSEWWLFNLMRRHAYAEATTFKDKVKKKLTKGRFGGTPLDLRGLGANLLTRAETFVKQAGASQLQLAIKSKFSRILHPYYTRHGYKCTDCEAYWGPSVYHYLKNL